MDLLDLWRDEISVRKVLNLIDRLPPASHYISAIAEDEELAETLGEADEDLIRGPRLTEWTPELAALASIADRLGALINVQVARGGGQPAKVTPYPRPVTAVQRVKERRRIERHNVLVARLLPNRDAVPDS